jgi:hypothetical protein
MEFIRIEAITDASGDATVYSRNEVKGKCVRVWIDLGTLTTVDFTVTGERTAEAIYSDTGLSGDTLVDPTTAAGVYVWQERIKVVVANGGATKTGQIWFAIADG